MTVCLRAQGRELINRALSIRSLKSNSFSRWPVSAKTPHYHLLEELCCELSNRQKDVATQDLTAPLISLKHTVSVALEHQKTKHASVCVFAVIITGIRPNKYPLWVLGFTFFQAGPMQSLTKHILMLKQMGEIHWEVVRGERGSVLIPSELPCYLQVMAKIVYMLMMIIMVIYRQFLGCFWSARLRRQEPLSIRQTNLISNLKLSFSSKNKKRVSPPKNENPLTIYSPSCCHRCIWLSIFRWTQRTIF